MTIREVIFADNVVMDTMDSLSLSKMSPNQVKTGWESSGTQNLIRYRPSRTYFARFKIGRKPFRKSLKTQSLTTAKLRLGDMLRQHRAKIEAGSALQNGKMTFAQAMRHNLEAVHSNVSLKPAS